MMIHRWSHLHLISLYKTHSIRQSPHCASFVVIRFTIAETHLLVSISLYMRQEEHTFIWIYYIRMGWWWFILFDYSIEFAALHFHYKRRVIYPWLGLENRFCGGDIIIERGANSGYRYPEPVIMRCAQLEISSWSSLWAKRGEHIYSMRHKHNKALRMCVLDVAFVVRFARNI